MWFLFLIRFTFCVCVCLCVYRRNCVAQGGQKRVSVPQELELQAAVTWVLGSELEASGGGAASSLSR